MWELVNKIGLAFSVLVILAGVIAVLWSQFTKQRSDILRQDNQDLTNRVTNLEHGRELDKAKIADLETRLEAEIKKNEYLDEMVVQRANVEKLNATVMRLGDIVLGLGNTLDNHHSESMDGLTDIKNAVEGLTP
jgi:uncharacterized protein YlxW (UPF0749 family)